MRQLITSALDLVGSLLIVAGVALAVARLYGPAGLVVGGVGVLVVSVLIDRPRTAKKRRSSR